MVLRKMFKLFQKKDEYEDVKKGFERICRLERKLNENQPGREPGMPIDWFFNNLPEIKKLFVNKPKLFLSYNSDKYDDIKNEKGCVKDINFVEEYVELMLDCSWKRFYKPSRVFFEIGKGIGNKYSMKLESREKIPSQLRLSYHNI